MRIQHFILDSRFVQFILFRAFIQIFLFQKNDVKTVFNSNFIVEFLVLTGFCILK